MCQLLGMNCNVPTDICFSFAGFSARGGQTDEHVDGWGIAFFEGVGCRTFMDVLPSNVSPIAEFVRRYPIKSKQIVAHIRKATRGDVSLENCHPFQRELWGRHWVFAHNGTLEGFEVPQTDYYSAVGTTDSEAAFCYMLEALRHRFPAREPSKSDIRAALGETTRELRRFGTFNYLLSDGNVLYAHCSTKLHYVLRQSPFVAAHSIDCDLTVDFSNVTSPNDKVAVIATLPLTDNEIWTPIEPNELVMFEDGTLVPHLSSGHRTDANADEHSGGIPVCQLAPMNDRC
jgi:predicted glutamine amidotransferase